MSKSIETSYQAAPSNIQNKYSNVPKEVLKVAEGMEQQFVTHMLNEMRKSVKSESPNNPAINYYNSLSDIERARIITETQNGLGIKDLVIKQLYPQFEQKPTQQGLQAYKEVNKFKGVTKNE